MKTSIVVGLGGIGTTYARILDEMGFTVTTVDPDINKMANFPNVESACFSLGSFDVAVISTPNHTHYGIARQLARRCGLVLVEKPGVKAVQEWQSLITDFPETRFMMIKNNQWRDNIEELKMLASASSMISINWINRDRVPNPGSWFTDKTKSFGGVSRDLMPHLLSIVAALDASYSDSVIMKKRTTQRWNLLNLTTTDYGDVNANGVYDVDDYCHLSLLGDDLAWSLTVDWRSMTEDDRSIEFNLVSGKKQRIELGLCPESAYKKMIDTAFSNLKNEDFWLANTAQDLWIHELITKL
jgi:predicted dehydrogenase